MLPNYEQKILFNMRLTEHDRNTIVQTIQAKFGQNTKIWLFGSRVDDNKRGGELKKPEYAYDDF
jgi:hypothetical protein